MVERNRAAGLDQFLQVSFRSGEAADAIQHHIYLHSGARAVRQGADKPACDLAFLKNVSFKVNAAAGFADSFEFSFVKVFPIGMDGQQAAMIYLSVSKGFEGAQECL